MEQVQSSTAATEALAAELAELRTLLSAQQATISQQQAAIAALEQRAPLAQTSGEAATGDTFDKAPTAPSAPSAVATDTPSHVAAPRRGTSRRGLLRGAAVASATAAVAAISVGGAEQAHAAPLATGGDFLLGESNSADATTFLSSTTAGIGVFESTATGGGTGIYGLTDTGVGLSGIASGNGTGVYGVSEGNGSGVIGKGNNGVGGTFQGALAPLLLGLGGSVGAPTSSTHSAGEIYLDGVATMWVCISGGTPGTWVQNILLGQANTADAMTILNSTATGATTLSVTASADSNAIVGGTGFGVGVQGNADNGTGVQGEDSGSGAGVVGTSVNGHGGSFSGGRAPLLLGLGGANGAPFYGLIGEIYLDSAATMWVCVHSGAPGLKSPATWVQVATFPNGATGGATTYLTHPIRLLDTRQGTTASSANQIPQAQLTGGSSYPVRVAGVNFDSVLVPAGAVGAIGNLTVVTPSSAGYLAVVPSGAGFLGTSNVNYTPGVILPNFFSVNLNGGFLDVFVDPHSAPVDVLVDLFAVVA